MLSCKDFQQNEKRSMKKVEIKDDSSEGEDVDFETDKSDPQNIKPDSNGVNNTSENSTKKDEPK